VATVLFVCKANRGRSVISQALFEQAAGGRHHAISAGSEAVAQGGPHAQVVEAMRECGIDVAAQQPQRLTTELATQADAVVTMGCGDACPAIPGKNQLRVDWDLPDPEDRPLEEVRGIREEIRRRVRELVSKLDEAPTPARSREGEL
jgi:protein-tyrosine-phosphatase